MRSNSMVEFYHTSAAHDSTIHDVVESHDNSLFQSNLLNYIKEQDEICDGAEFKQRSVTRSKSPFSSPPRIFSESQ